MKFVAAVGVAMSVIVRVLVHLLGVVPYTNLVRRYHQHLHSDLVHGCGIVLFHISAFFLVVNIVVDGICVKEIKVVNGIVWVHAVVIV